MSFTLAQLQQEQVAWVQHNFGGRRPWMPLLGIVEELGELTSARCAGLGDEVLDGLADAVIFLADYCTAMDWQLQELWDGRTSMPFSAHPVPEHHHEARLLVIVGKLQHHHLKLSQGIRGSRAEHEAAARMATKWLLVELVRLVPASRLSLRAPEQALLDVVESTWSRVRQRDWKKDPKKGGQS